MISGSKIEVFIDRLSVGGRGVARHEGLVVFIPNAAPHDKLLVQLIRVKKNFAEAEIVRIVEPSPHRVTPPCPVAGVCGGCTWQQVEYSEQLRQKRELVRESLRKFSGFDVTRDDLVQPVSPSPKPFRYRNRVQFHFEKGRLGFHKKSSHELVDISDCPITEEPIAKQIPELKKSIGVTGSGRFEMFISQDGRVSRRNATAVDDDHGGLAFSQVNSAQNEILVRETVDLFVLRLGSQFSGTIYDFYCGNGNFTFPLVKAFPGARSIGVELSSDSIDSAREKTAAAGEESRMQWHVQDVGTYLTLTKLNDSDVVLLDPPRIGCAPEVVAAIAASPVKSVFYVSCNPVTLGRDLRALRDAGFDLSEVRPFDMFPQTDHVETVAVLTRRL
ncbi:MAG: class I SAM-dependent RNA methyltransferase [Bdellovibrionota bacterium]